MQRNILWTMYKMDNRHRFLKVWTFALCKIAELIAARVLCAHRGNLQRTARVPLIALTTFSRTDLCSSQVEVRVIISNFCTRWKVSLEYVRVEKISFKYINFPRNYTKRCSSKFSWKLSKKEKKFQVTSKEN